VPAVEQEQARIALDAVANENLVGSEGAGFGNGVANSLLFLGAEVSVPPQLFQVYANHDAALSATAWTLDG
jgi:hypothetical protein